MRWNSEKAVSKILCAIRSLDDSLHCWLDLWNCARVLAILLSRLRTICGQVTLRSSHQIDDRGAELAVWDRLVQQEIAASLHFE